MVVLIAIGIIITGAVLWGYMNEQKVRDDENKARFVKEEKIKNEAYEFFNSNRIKLKKGVATFKDTFPDNGYFSNYALTVWRSDYLDLYKEVKQRNLQSSITDVLEQSTISMFLYYMENCYSLKNKHNEQFVCRELESYASFFRGIEEHGLDIDQQVAVITDDDNNLIVAGAGSGKTTTIVGKVNYIIEKYKVPPSEILLISFTRKSAMTLAKRINIEGLEVSTFHRFGKNVISQVENKQPSIFDDSQYNSLIKRFFNELICDQEFLKKVTIYFTDFLKPEKSQDEFEDQGSYFQYMKDHNFKSYKSKQVLINGKTTFKMEVVKSIEECKIANYLLFNNVDYEYELPYRHDTATQSYRQYKPDFTINPDGQCLYLEHFGIDKHGKVPGFFVKSELGQTIEQASEEYNNGIKWKRELHSECGTHLIETYSYEMFEGLLFDNLKNKLESAGVRLVPKTPLEIWRIINESAKGEVDSLISLFQTFITLMKSNNYEIDDVKVKNAVIKDSFLRQRNSLFIDIIGPIYEKYQQYLGMRKEIDFSDMINNASNYISSGQFAKKFSYIIVDEFQDISIGRYQLLKAIKNINPWCKFFCVGDDWQSIYRFSGSDISLFKNFEEFFGYTVKSKIEKTYRFNSPLIDLSSEFILKNPNQAEKKLTGVKTSKTTDFKIVYSTTNNQDDTIALKQIFEEILLTSDWERKGIYILGRYSFDIGRIKNEDGTFLIDEKTESISFSQVWAGGIRTITAKYFTVHSAKGLEADIVVLLNCNSGKHGFPSEMSDDPVLNLLLSESDQFENGEERRLFYVAMTRAKDMVYFVSDSSYKSKFIVEIELASEAIDVKKCPKCKKGDLIKRSGVNKDGKHWSFYGCSNFLYGCNYKKWI